MGIVIITIQEYSKIKFVNDLISNEVPVSLVIFQKRKKLSLKEKLYYYTKNPKQFISILFLYLRPDLRDLLASIRSLKTAPRSKSDLSNKKISTIEVENINGPEVFSKLKALNPKLIAVWGSGIISKKIINTSPHVINLHLGIAPTYKGALANQFAIAKADYSNIGYTIHYINEKVDDGDIIYQKHASIKKDPNDTFQTLLLDAHQNYVYIIKKIYSTNKTEVISQDTSKTIKTTLLKEWTPSKRLALALFLKKWQRNKSTPTKKIF